MKKNSGFTLIELLIVITIIGILSTIVLNSLSTSRVRAYDSKVKQQLSGFRAAAEMYFLNQTPSGYGPASSDCSSGIFANFDEKNGSPGSYIDPNNLPTVTVVKCSSTDSGSSSAYAVKATMYSGTEYWCVDSNGASKLISGPIGNPVLVCPL